MHSVEAMHVSTVPPDPVLELELELDDDEDDAAVVVVPFE